MAELKTYREAAITVHRSVLTIKRWRRNGLPMGWGIRDGQRVRLVDNDVLRAWWRERMKQDPVWQNRLRRDRQENDAS